MGWLYRNDDDIDSMSDTQVLDLFFKLAKDGTFDQPKEVRRPKDIHWVCDCPGAPIHSWIKEVCELCWVHRPRPANEKPTLRRNNQNGR